MAKKTVKVKKHPSERIVPKEMADRVRAAADPALIPIRAVDANGTETPLPGAASVRFVLRNGCVVSFEPSGEFVVVNSKGTGDGFGRLLIWMESPHVMTLEARR